MVRHDSFRYNAGGFPALGVLSLANRRLLAMLDFRQTSRKRIHASPTSRRWHWFLLVLLLGILLIVAENANNPNIRRWLGQMAQPSQETPHPRIDNRLDGEWAPATEPIVAAKALPDSDAAPTTQYRLGGRPEWIASIQDDTPSLPREQPWMFSVFQVLQETNLSDLRKASAGHVGYVQLFRQPNQYRGRPITVSGTVRRVRQLPFPENACGLSGYWEVWLFPADNPSSPLVIYCLELPDGFPTNQPGEGVEATGIFFKRWAYEAADAWRTAPIVLAKTLQWRPPSAMPPPAPPALSTIAGLFLLAALLAGLGTWCVYVRTRPCPMPLPKQLPRVEQVRLLDHGQPQPPSDRRVVQIAPCEILENTTPNASARGLILQANTNSLTDLLRLFVTPIPLLSRKAPMKKSHALGRLRTIAFSLGWLVLSAAGMADEPTGEKTGERPTSPRALFQSLGVGGDTFDRLKENAPLSPDETDVVLRVLYRLRLFPAVDMDRWALDASQIPEALAQPSASRGMIFRLRGRIVEVEPCEPSADAAQRYELKKYYRCRMEAASPPITADIYTENVPAAWQKGAQPEARGGALGVFLKTGEQISQLIRRERLAELAQRTREDGSEIVSLLQAGRPTLVFCAARLAWYPDDLLGNLGMDVGLLDAVRDGRPLAAGDREAFYQMLAAVGRASNEELLRQANANLPTLPKDWRWSDSQGRQQYSVVPLFNDPKSQRGRLAAFSGTARRIEKIEVDDPDIVARFGITHYYEVFLFTDDSSGNPLTFCLLNLPENMPYGDVPHYGETVRIAGFFLKTWSYRVPKMADPALSPGDPKTQRQLSPLLIGRGLVWYPAPKPADTTTSTAVIAILFCAAMLVLWVAAWRSRRQEREMEEQIVAAPSDLNAKINLEQPAEARHDLAPDFTKIAEMDQGTDEGDLRL